MARKRGHGEGTIYQRNDGYWLGQITVGRDPATGRLRRITVTGKTRREVQERVDAIRREIQTGTFALPQNITVEAWLRHWLENYAKVSLKPKTWGTYEYMARVHIIPEIGHIPLQKLKASDLQALYNRKYQEGRLDGKGGLSSRSVHMMNQIMRSALNQALKENLVARNVTEAVRLPKLRHREMQPLRREEVQAFLAAARGHRLYAAFLLELTTGLRRGALLALRWRDLDFENGLLHVRRILHRVKLPNGEKKTALVFEEPKTVTARRTVPVPKAVLAELKAHKARQNEEKLKLGEAYEDHDLVFATPLGKPLDPDNFTKQFTRLLEKAGIPKVRFHDLRHTVATLLLEADEHPKVVQELLGHARISITLDLYTHARPELKRRAVESLSGMVAGNQDTPAVIAERLQKKR